MLNLFIFLALTHELFTQCEPSGPTRLLIRELRFPRVSRLLDKLFTKPRLLGLAAMEEVIREGSVVKKWLSALE
jgi:hypothetical protein